MINPSISPSVISFMPLSEEHFPLIRVWFNEPHVQAFYSLRTWTLEEVRNKLTPNLQGIDDLKSYIIFIRTTPIGYIQCYPVKKHPWDNQNLTDEIIENSAGSGQGIRARPGRRGMGPAPRHAGTSSVRKTL